MMKNPIATEGRLIIKIDKEETQTSGGIYLARSENCDTKSGKVISVGGKKHNENQDFEVGQTVYWQSGLGQEIRVNGEDYLIINQNNILAIEGNN